MQRMIPEAMPLLEEQQAIGYRGRDIDRSRLYFRMALPPHDPQIVVKQRLHQQVRHLEGQRDPGEIESNLFKSQQQMAVKSSRRVRRSFG